ncbi:hypothetical protein M422DRAFT_265008 [Sphaerobolus stellatus SS14]|uniref:Uncharacterized protein n=1 Tax=Sphaerobolus stellatus (strain SS14) TaxID=990650 RepID=A0A0C9UV40_SPHS4|nr:hypothetical protein M422DRAFT_265008 [Sphaerobolus stellatus SS14]
MQSWPDRVQLEITRTSTAKFKKKALQSSVVQKTWGKLLHARDIREIPIAELTVLLVGSRVWKLP